MRRIGVVHHGLWLSLLLTGCLERGLVPATPCTTTEVGYRPPLDPTDTVDLLFVVDDSESMAAAQLRLRAEIPRMISMLATGNRESWPRIREVRSIHVAVVSTNMGGDAATPSGPIERCGGRGDDGVMRGDDLALPCATYPMRIFEFERGTDPNTLGEQVGCIANLGTSGCVFEQPLEAALKALSPADPTSFASARYTPPVFAGDTLGHAGPGGLNDGFHRDGAVLAIVLLTDEDDCSAADLRVFDASAAEYGPGDPRAMGLRCAEHSEALHSIDRYVEGFAQLRGRPDMVMFAAITGVPLTAVPEVPYDEILGDELMQEVDDPTRPDASPLRPACHAATGAATPARRIVEVARGLRAWGASTTVQSICADTFAPAIDSILERIGNVMVGQCLARPRDQRADGTIACDLLEFVDRGTSCAMEGLELVDTEESWDGATRRELCRVPQVRPAEGVSGRGRGWYYDSTSEAARRNCFGGARISFSAISTSRFTEMRFNCFEVVEPSGGSGVGLGSFCMPFTPAGPDNPCSTAEVPSGNPEQRFACDPLLHTCGVACASDADCTAAGLLSYVCDGRSVLEAVGGDMSRVPDVDGSGGGGDETDAASRYGYCVSPTC